MMNPWMEAKQRGRDCRWEIYNTTKGVSLCWNAIVADTFGRRGVGLLFRKNWRDLDGLLLVPCASIHTFGMRMHLDVCFLDSRMRVVQVRHGLGPWRLASGGPGASCTLELPPGKLEETGTEIGDLLCLRKGGERSQPESQGAG